MKTINDIVMAQVAKARAEARMSWGAGDVELDEGQLAAAHNLRIIDLWSRLPNLQRTVMAWLDKLDVVKPHLPNAPMTRTTVGQAAHVVCLGWTNPKAVSRWVYETNTFWLSYGRHIETNPQGE